jgi:hypothetical protein
LRILLKSGWVFGIMFLLTACTTQLRKADAEKPLKIYPAPPDTTRIQYLTSFSKSSDITGKRSAFMEYILGEEQDQNIIKPYGIATTKGKIYICDSMFEGLEIIDLAEKSFTFFKPDGLGQLKKPINCSTETNGTLYVADAGRNQVVVFSGTGKYLSAFSVGENSRPTDVAVNADRIFITDIKNHRVVIVDKDSKSVIGQIAAQAGEEGFLNQPSNLFITDERLYVSDFGDFKVKIFDLDGNFIETIGSYGRSPGQFVRPKGIAVDDADRLFVVDAGFENVQIFNRSGDLMMFFGGAYKTPGDMWLPAKVSIDYQNLDYFREYVHPSLELKYLVYVTNQYGPDKVSVYGFVEPRLQ